MKAKARPRVVEAVMMANGNWLVTEADGSRHAFRGVRFHELFELEPEPGPGPDDDDDDSD